MIIRNQTPSAVTEVSNVFIDEYMAEANGEFVKVYLYLLRLSGGEELSVSALADRLNHTEADVERALRYWEKQGVLSREGEELRLLPVKSRRTSGREAVRAAPARKEAQSQPASVPVRKETQPVPEKPAEQPVRLAERPGVKPVSREAMEKLQEDEAFKQVLFVSEIYLARPLSPKDIELFAYLYDGLHFPEDLLEYLVEYCVDGGHRSYRYMERVALNWHAEGKMTVEQAKESQRNYSRANKQVMKAFGIAGRVLSLKEQKFVKKWLEEDRMSLSVIVEACGCTMTAIHEPSFEYTDKVLAGWREAGVRTVEEARTHRESRKTGRKKAQGEIRERQAVQPKNRFQNYEQRKIDYDELLNQSGINLYSGREA